MADRAERLQTAQARDAYHIERAAIGAVARAPNGWHRDTAARLIFEQQDQALVPALEKLAANPPRCRGRFMPYGLWKVWALKADHLLSVLEKGTAPARVQAMQLAEQFARIRAWCARCLPADNPSHDVLYQQALTASVFPASEEKSIALVTALGQAKATLIEAVVTNALNGDELGDLFVAMHGACTFRMLRA